MFEANLDRWLDKADGFMLHWLPPMAAVLGVKLPARARKVFEEQLPEIAKWYREQAAEERADGFDFMAEDTEAELAETCKLYGVEVPR
jgi:hypothetical protein